MLKNANFLCELGTEEIPAGYLPPAIDAIIKMVRGKLHDERIDFTDIDVYATPRRIAIMVSGLADAQRSEEVEVKGPAVKAAYDGDGNPTKALVGFMKGNGVSSDDITTRETEKGEYIFAQKKLESRQTVEMIPGVIEDIVNKIPFPKRMKWSDKEVTFPRPINYFLILFNEKVVPFAIEGIESSDETRGHYVQANQMLKVTEISTYESILQKNAVTVDHKKRKELIRKELARVSGELKAYLIEDEELLDVVTFLVEDPHIVTCSFEKEFLAIPDVALIAEMKEHQKYFALRDDKGKLINTFLVISNNPPTENIRKGNERVIAARFSDAKFFYDDDRKKKLVDMVDSLKDVLFHKELGSIYDKVLRMQKVAGAIGEAIGLDEKTKKNIDRTLLICKTDLNTAMVNEFASLQGKIGRIYALLDGEDEAVAEAIENHYRPRFQGDMIPASIVSVVASLSEKLDNIFGSFSVGNIPKGSQDPYALRRQANAVVELLLSNEINLSLGDLLSEISESYKGGAALVHQLLDFISARVKTIYSDRGIRHDEIDAVLAVGESDYLELFRRAESINSFRSNESFSEMLLSFKRMNNIVAGFRKDNSDYKLSFDESKLEEKEEKDLNEFFSGKRKEISDYIAKSSYIDLFKLLIQGKSIIDNFFDKVLVMDKRNEIRDNRLYLLEDILGNFKNLLNFSKISDSKE